MQLYLGRRFLSSQKGCVRLFCTQNQKIAQQEYNWSESKPLPPDKNVSVDWNDYPEPPTPECTDFDNDLISLIEKGDKDAQFVRASELMNRRLASDSVENRGAAALFLASAKQSHVEAEVEIGKMFLMGYGVEREHKSAIQFFGRAANHGHPNARAFLGSMYFRGYGIKQNFDEARRLLDESSKMGNSRAKRYLAEMFEKGVGLNKDIHVAMRLAEKASEDPDLSSDVRGEACAIAGRGHAHVKDYLNAAKYFQIGSDLRDKDCQANLGHIYDVGVPGIESDVYKSCVLLLDAANQGQTRAHRDLGILYAYGRPEQDFSQNVTEGLHWLDIATKGGFLDAYLRLGEIYASGNNRYPGVAQNLALAKKVFQLCREESTDSEDPRDKLPGGVWRRLLAHPLSIRNLIDDYERGGLPDGEQVRLWRGYISDLKPNPKPSSK